MDAPEKQLLLDIHAKVIETATQIGDLKEIVIAHLDHDREIHAAHQAAISGLQGDGKASNLKHRVAIGLGLAGASGGAASAAPDTWVQAILRAFGG